MNNKTKKNDEKQEEFEDLIIEDSDLDKRMNNYINYGIGRIDHYENSRRIFLELNLTILIVISTILMVFYNNLSPNAKYYIIIIFVCYLTFSFINLLYNTLEHKTSPKNQNWFEKIFDKFIEFLSRWKKEKHTDKEWRTIWFYRGNVSQKKDIKNLIDFSKENFNAKTINNPEDSKILKNKLIRDDIKDLYNLYYYQAHYYKLAFCTRKITLYGLLFIPLFLIFMLIL